MFTNVRIQTDILASCHYYIRGLDLNNKALRFTEVTAMLSAGFAMSAYLSRTSADGSDKDPASDTATDAETDSKASMPDMKGMLSKMMIGAKTAVFGSVYWIPTDDKAIASIPAHLVDEHYVFLPDTTHLKDMKEKGNCPKFVAVRGKYGEGSHEKTIYHLCVIAESHSTPKIYSFLRTEDENEAKKIFDKYSSYVDLFQTLESKDDVRDFLPAIQDEIEKHPLWLPVHIAAKMNLTRYFEQMQAFSADTLQKNLMERCAPEGTYPLLLATREGHDELVEAMLNTYGAHPRVFDASGNNVMHTAAMRDGQMVQTLAKFNQAKALVNSTNNDSEAPIHVAVRSMNPSAVGALLECGAKLHGVGKGNTPLRQAMLSDNDKCAKVVEQVLSADPAEAQYKDETTGNTLMHVVAGKMALSALLASGCVTEINECNLNGWTAMHAHAHSGSLGCVVTLVAYGADLDVADRDGNTPLHLAVFQGNLAMVKAMIVFGADVNSRNTRGDSAIHLASKLNKTDIVGALQLGGARRCESKKSDCSDACCPAVQDVTDVKTPVKKDAEFSTATLRAARRDQCIAELKGRVGSSPQHGHLAAMSLDGGGIRGLVLVMVLMAIERHLPEGASLTQYLDWIAGTSTGSYVCGALAKGKTLRECQRIYLRFKDKIFQGWTRPYDTNTLENFIEKEMGAETTLADVPHPRLIITTVAARVAPCHLHLFRNYKLPALSDEQQKQLGADDPKDVRVMYALRCSSAAPTYFTSVDGTYVDGGLIANNPTLDLLAELELCSTLAKQHSESSGDNDRAEVTPQLGLLLSVGCGRVPDQPIESLDMTGSWNQFASFVKNMGLIMIEQATQAEGAPVDRSAAWCSSLGAAFFRFTPRLSKPIELNTTDDAELVQLLWDTLLYLHGVRDEVRQCAEVLQMLGPSAKRRDIF